MIHLFLADAAAAVTPDVLTKITTGLLLGAAGQVARTIVGLKKTTDEAKAKGTSFAKQFDASQLFVSLLIGAVAGLFGSLAMWDKLNDLNNRDVLMAIVAAGYAGADFIEGFIRNEAAPLKKLGAPVAAGIDKGLGA